MDNTDSDPGASSAAIPVASESASPMLELPMTIDMTSEDDISDLPQHSETRATKPSPYIYTSNKIVPFGRGRHISSQNHQRQNEAKGVRDNSDESGIAKLSLSEPRVDKHMRGLRHADDIDLQTAVSVSEELPGQDGLQSLSYTRELALDEAIHDGDGKVQPSFEPQRFEYSRQEATVTASVLNKTELGKISSSPSDHGTEPHKRRSLKNFKTKARGRKRTFSVEKFVSFLIRCPSIDGILARANLTRGLKSEGFHESLAYIIKMYSEELAGRFLLQEKRSRARLDRGVDFIAVNTRQISRRLIMHYKTNNGQFDRQTIYELFVDLKSRYSEAEADGAGWYILEQDVETSLSSGQPFKTLERSLGDLVLMNQYVTEARAIGEHLIRLLPGDNVFRKIFESFANTRGLSFSLWLKLKIDSLAINLGNGPNAQTTMAACLTNYSEYLSLRISEKFKDKPASFPLRGQDSLSGRQPQHYLLYSSDEWEATDNWKPAIRYKKSSEEVLEDMSIRLPFKILDEGPNHAWGTLSSTQAFRDFVSYFRGLAFPSFITESRKMMRETGTLIEHSGKLKLEPEARYLLSILAELQWCFSQHGEALALKIDGINDFSLVDRLKLTIELRTGGEWNWWPLCPPPRTASTAMAQLKLKEFSPILTLESLVWSLIHILSMFETYSVSL